MLRLASLDQYVIDSAVRFLFFRSVKTEPENLSSRLELSAGTTQATMLSKFDLIYFYSGAA